MRVFELAKELNVKSKELLEKLGAMDVDVASHSSAITDDQANALRKAYGVEIKAPPAPAVEPPPPPVEKPEPPPAPKIMAHTPNPVAVKKPEPPREAPAPVATQDEEGKTLVIKPPIVVREFAELLGLKPNQLIAELMGMNIFASINQKIEIKTAQALAAKHGFTLEQEKKKPPEKKAPVPVEVPVETRDTPDDLKLRPPVVCFMGHVDHGKTSLLDKIRNAKVAAGEAGGITQHIGAYTVDLGKQRITFLDTPGHEAFTKMRARGANLTDIAVIVIDAVDGLMPQTREAIQHAKAAKVAVMIAINKIDLRAANPDRVKQQLQQEGLAPEDWGGDTICCEVSAATGDGIDNLLEMISLQAEMLELKANPERHAKGFIIEAQLETGMGPTATLLVRNGTLKTGDPVVVGPHWGKMKALVDHTGKKVKEAGPSEAVKVLGLSGVPDAGSEFTVVESEKLAKEIHEQRQETELEKSRSGSAPKKQTLEDLLAQAGKAEVKELPVIIKADVQGSLEAILHMLDGIKSDKVELRIILTGVGNITVNDTLLAKASRATIIGFNVGKENGVNAAVKREGIEIRHYSIIYELMDEMKSIMTGMLEPVLRETVHGQADVKQVFDLGSKKGKVAGCVVSSGKVNSKSRVRLKRRGDVLYEGRISSLRRFQNEAAEVREGQECGIRLDNFTDLVAGDVLEFYDVEKIVQQL